MDRLFPITSILILFLIAASPGLTLGDDDQCVYTIYIRTGSVIKAGTDSKIGLTLSDVTGREVVFADLEAWGGLEGPDHDYYERGALDSFSGRGPCGLITPLCKLNLTSDGSGPHHGWFCEYVEVTATGPHVPCSQTLFYVRQWLASDAAPYQLFATVDGCEEAGIKGERGHFVVGEAESSASSV